MRRETEITKLLGNSTASSKTRSGQEYNNAHLWDLTGTNRYQALVITDTGDSDLDFVWTGTQPDGTAYDPLGGILVNDVRVGRSPQTSSS